LGTLGITSRKSKVPDKSLHGTGDSISLAAGCKKKSSARRKLMINLSPVDSNTTPSTPILLRRNVRKAPCDLENKARKKRNMQITPKNAVSLGPETTNGEKETFDRPPAATPQSSGQSTDEIIHNRVNVFLSSQISEGTNPSAGARNGDSTAEASFTNDIDCADGMHRDEIEDSQNTVPGKPAPINRNDPSTRVGDTKPMASAKASDSFPDGMDSRKRGNLLMNSASTKENTLPGVGRNTRTPVSPKTAIETSQCQDSKAAAAGTLLENTQNAGTRLTDSPLPNEDASIYCDKEVNTCNKRAECLVDNGIDESAHKTTLVTSSEISQSKISQKYDSEEEYERNLAKALEESKKQSTANQEDDKIPRPNENYDAELQKALMESQKQLEIDTKNRKRKIEFSCKTSFDDSGSLVDLVSDGPDSDEEYSNQLKRAMEASLQDEKSSVQSTGRWESIPPLGIESFENAVESFMNAHGGFQKIESGAVICEGNNRFKKKSDTCGGENQERAQYGRITIEGFKRVIDKLEGRPSLLSDEKLYKQDSEKGTDGRDDTNDDDKVCNGDSDVRNPEGRKIKAFVDIGHGLGIQVMQVGLCLGVPSRGVELMRNRHMLAKELESDLKNVFSAQSFEKIELEMCDFTHGFLPNKITINKADNETSISQCRFSEYDSLKRNVALRRFLMCKDLSDDEQRHLVIFGNNFNGVFGTRAGKPDVPTLDQHLAEMFANMEVGGRIVTLEDLSPLFSRNSWFRRDKFMSGSHSVSWSDLMSVQIFCLTKLSNTWKCKDCGYEHNPVVDQYGKLHETCWCGNTERNTRGKRRKK